MNRNVAVAAILSLILGIAAVFVALSINHENFLFPSSGDASGSGLEDAPNDWYSQHLRAMNEPAIGNATSETYRFTWLRTFHHPISIRVQRVNGEATLVATVLDGAGGYAPGKISNKMTRNLSPSEFQEIASIFATEQFSRIPSSQDSTGKDGAQWIIESTKPQYKVVHYWSPQSGPVHRIGLKMLKLSGIQISTNEIY